MGKTGTSKKQKNFSIDDMPIVKVRAGVKISPWKPSVKMDDFEFVTKALLECVRDGDDEAFMEIFIGYIRARNRSKLAKEAGVGRQTIYDLISQDSDPRISTLFKLLKAGKAVRAEAR